MSSAAVVGIAAGCGDDAAAPGNVVLDDTQAQAAGNAVADQASNLVGAFTLDGLAQGPLSKAVAQAPVEPRLRRLMLAALLAGEECAAFSDTTDTDADGVPDDLIVTFASPACTTMADSGTAILSGSFRVTDRGTNPGFDVAYSNVRLRFDSATNDDYIDVRLNGTQGVSSATSSATLGENLSLAAGLRIGGEVASVTVQDNWSATFTAAQGALYDVRAPLPDGTLTVNGSTGWTNGTIGATLALSTVAPLVYDDACTSDPVFDSGELRALVVGNRGGAFVGVQFVGCGQDPIVVLVGRPGS
jgi:hypothetical protein